MSYLVLVVLSMVLTSCSGEFWQGMAMGGAMFLDGMASSYAAASAPASSSYGYGTYNVPNVANSFNGWSGGAAYSGVSSVGSSSSSTSTNSSSSTASVSRHTCPLCNGKGTIIRESYTATYGCDQKTYCSVCGQSFWQSSGHRHITCTQCHGKGSF